MRSPAIGFSDHLPKGLYSMRTERFIYILISGIIMIKLTAAAKDTIRANSFKSTREIAELILQKHGIVVGQSHIRSIIKEKESTTEETTDLVISEIENNIAEFVNEKSKEYLISMDDNIQNIERRLSAPDLPDESFIKLSKLLSDQIKALLSMKGENHEGKAPRPTLNLNINFDKMVEQYDNYKKSDDNDNKKIEDTEYKLL